MKTLLLATAACLALSLPAMAQPNNPANGAATSTQQQVHAANVDKNQSKDQKTSQMQAKNDQRQAKEINPSSLSKSKIRQIQMNLNKDGFDAKNVDGVWGEDTREALRNFQQVKHLPGNGKLTQQTLAELSSNNSGNEGRTVTNSESENGQPARSNSPQSAFAAPAQATANSSNHVSSSPKQNANAQQK